MWYDSWLYGPSWRERWVLRCPSCGAEWAADVIYELGGWFFLNDDDAACRECLDEEGFPVEGETVGLLPAGPEDPEDLYDIFGPAAGGVGTVDPWPPIPIIDVLHLFKTTLGPAGGAYRPFPPSIRSTYPIHPIRKRVDPARRGGGSQPLPGRRAGPPASQAALIIGRAFRGVKT
jgi:hypothetical protein